MVVLAHMSPGSKRELGNAKLVLPVDLSEEAAKWRLELDLGNQAFSIYPYRAATCLRGRFARRHRQGHQRQRCECLQDLSSLVFVAGHEDLPCNRDRTWRPN